MSTRLERAERQAAKGKLSPTKHREIVIAERNKEILALQKHKRNATAHLKWALMALELTANGLRYRHGLVKGETPGTGDTEMWNLNAAKLSIEAAMRGDPSPVAATKEGSE